MTDTVSRSTALPQKVLTPRAAMQVLLGCVAAVAIVVVAVGPGRFGGAMAHVPPIHLHAPDLSLVARASVAIKIHLAAVLAALAIGIVLMLGVKGRTLHRTLGWVWVVAMMAGAVSSLFIRLINHGHLSLIHLLAGWTIVALPMAVFAARRRKVRMHARFMTGLFTGGLIVAGALAFMPGRLMWDLFFR